MAFEVTPDSGEGSIAVVGVAVNVGDGDGVAVGVGLGSLVGKDVGVGVRVGGGSGVGVRVGICVGVEVGIIACMTCGVLDGSAPAVGGVGEKQPDGRITRSIK